VARRPKLWFVVASVFTFINLAGGVMAAASGEALHTLVHVALTIVGAYWVARLASRSRLQTELGDSQTIERLDQLQQRLDAIALGVERVGEAQRYTAKLAERATTSPADADSVMRRPDES
jgi:hypothetical protein